MNEKKIHVRGNQIHVKITGEEALPTIVFLHGFTGSTETWKDISSLLDGKFRTVAIDLIGHGKSQVFENPDRYSMEEQVEDLELLFNELSLQNFTLVGYSMGGRVALAYTVKYPGRVSSLILESASPGLQTEEERNERRQTDQKLAEKIKEKGLLAFVDFWENIPLFASQKGLSVDKQLAIREERLSQSVIGLSNSLIGMGTGSQASYWDVLSSIQLPVLLLTGEIDTKFVFIAREMKKRLQSVRHQIIKDVGHAIHVENPFSFATMIEKHVTELKN